MQAVVVTTAHRGVFFGYIENFDLPETCPKSLKLTKCKNCLYWPSEVKGFLGLAVTGPLGSSRVGPTVEELIVYDVTCVAKATDEATTRWENDPWN